MTKQQRNDLQDLLSDLDVPHIIRANEHAESVIKLTAGDKIGKVLSETRIFFGDISIKMELRCINGGCFFEIDQNCKYENWTRVEGFAILTCCNNPLSAYECKDGTKPYFQVKITVGVL